MYIYIYISHDSPWYANENDDISPSPNVSVPAISASALESVGPPHQSNSPQTWRRTVVVFQGSHPTCLTWVKTMPTYHGSLVMSPCFTSPNHEVYGHIESTRWLLFQVMSNIPQNGTLTNPCKPSLQMLTRQKPRNGGKWTQIAGTTRCDSLKGAWYDDKRCWWLTLPSSQNT